MPDPDLILSSRIAALDQAVRIHIDRCDFDERCGVDADATLAAALLATRNTAEVLLAWLRGPRIIELHAGPVVSQATGLPTGTVIHEGDTVQIHDDEQYDLALVEKDLKGFPTSDPGVTVAWRSADEAVVPVNVSGDGLTFHVVAGSPGSTVVGATVTLPDGTVLPESTEAVDVVPSGVATVSLVAGPVTKQPGL